VEKIKSRDGTPIAYHRRGRGSPLVLVPGAGAANPVSWPVTPALEAQFTVHAVDRRGRGESGDGSVYSVQREFEDIAAVVDSVGEPADLLGHSFGGMLALEAALLTRNVRKLILYEGWAPPSDAPTYPQGFVERLEALLEAGELEEVLIAHYREDAGLTPDAIEKLKASPAWPARLATAHTLPRELRAGEQYRFDAQRFKDLRTPTLVLLGGDSPEWVKASGETLRAALPNGRMAIMPGQQHIAQYTAPDLFLREVLAFLCGSD
jgi:pimeloyl-ACP methyl ester carboxylesterase